MADDLESNWQQPYKMVLVLSSCVMDRQDHHKEKLWLFTILYDDRSTSDLTFGYPESDMASGIAGTNAELIGFQAKALAKHWQHVEEMRRQISQRKHEWLKYEKENWHTIEDLDFQLGSLVLIWSAEVESSLDKKIKPRYMGPMVVIS